MRRFLKGTLASAVLLTSAITAVSSHASTLTATSFFNGSMYQYYTESAGVLWDTANAFAISLGGHLATLTSDAENAHVVGIVDSNPSLFGGIVGPWLGGECGSDCGVLANWAWVTGEDNTRLTSGASWSGGQPDGAENDPSHLLFYNGGSLTGPLWGDYGNNCGAGACTAGFVKGFIVESVAPVPLPAAFPLLLVALGGLGFAGRRRRKAA